MAITHGLDFALLYVCVLALFGYLSFWFVPVAAKVVYAAVKTWLAPHQDEDRHSDFWFDGHHSQ
jgi:hypothetical protein